MARDVVNMSVLISGDIKKDFIDDLAAGKKAASWTMEYVADNNKLDKRAAVVGAGLSKRLSNTVQSKSYPKSPRTSLNAAGLVFSKASYLHVFYEGAVIKSKDGFWLAIPTPEAGRGARNKRITPHLFEQRTGLRLRFVYRKNKASLLVVDGARINSKGKAKADKKGLFQQTVIVFFLVPQVRMPKLFDFKNIDYKYQQMMNQLLSQKWEEYSHG